HSLYAKAKLEEVVGSQSSWIDRWMAMENGEPIPVRELAVRYRSTRELLKSDELREADIGSLPQMIADFDRLVVDASLRWPEAPPAERERISAELKSASGAIIASARESR